MEHEYDEKNVFRASGGEAPPYDSNVDRVVGDKGIRMGEAADMYGDLQTAEEYGYVTRGCVFASHPLYPLYYTPYAYPRLSGSLKSRHIQFIALGGTIGTGLFLGIGKSLTQSGPLSLLLGYTITGLAIFAMVSYGDSFMT